MVLDLYFINCIVFVLPFALLIFFNGRLLHRVWHASSALPHFTASSQEESTSELYEVSKVVIAITFVFFITYLPYPLPNIDNHVLSNHMFDLSRDGMSCFTLWCKDFLMFKTQYISSSVNFIIYCILRRSFRRKMVELLKCQKKHLYIRNSFLMKDKHVPKSRSRMSNTVTEDMHLWTI